MAGMNELYPMGQKEGGDEPIMKYRKLQAPCKWSMMIRDLRSENNQQEGQQKARNSTMA